METINKVHGRRRAGGRHSNPLTFADELSRPAPKGKYAAYRFDDVDVPVFVPPMPDRTPTAGVPIVPAATAPVEKVVITEIPGDGEELDVPTNTGPLTIVAGDPVPLDTGSQQQVRRSRHRGAAMFTALATGGLLLAGGGHVLASAPKKVTTTMAATQVKPTDLETETAMGPEPEPEAITAPTDVVVEQVEVEVETQAAPLPVKAEAPVPATSAPRHLATPAPAPAPAPAVANTTTPAPAAVPSSGKGAIIAQAAINQIGVGQDCTMLATNALRAAGVNFHGWPWQYSALGTDVGVANAQPGDLLLYAAQNGMPAHIGVYIGNGRAIHGGWEGNQTVEWSMNVGYPAFPPYAAIRVA